MTEHIIDMGQGLALYKVGVDEVSEQDVNARAMSPQMFERLAATIERDGRLESLPLMALNAEGKIEIISGHHRVRASRAAGVDDIFALVDTTGLNRDQIAAKQLAHNSIAGTDEKQLLRQILDSIEDVDARLEAFITPESLDMPDIESLSLPALDLDVKYRTTLFVFLPHQAERFDKTVEAVVAEVDLNRDQVYLADIELYDRWKALMSRVSKEYDARALSTVIMRLLDAAQDALGIDTSSPESIDPGEWVALPQLFGSAMVPPDAAEVIEAAVAKMQEAHDLGQFVRWRAIEYWAADYLAGP
tara:strand:+ start:267 stop:1175 length:909 start_codon:yes stop_codon:yes gene_type:complete